MTSNSGIAIRPAMWPQDEPAALGLLRDYLHFLQTNPAGPVQICLGDYERELAALASRWNGERSALLLAWRQTEAMGCIGVQLLSGRPGAAEVKRLWTSPASRGIGLGRQLIQAAIEWARERSARELLLDTLPAAMPEALRLYLAMGFEECGKYNSNPVPGIFYLRLQIG